MVVVIIVGLLAALAVPSMRLATYDRHAYQDAGAIMQLFREARLRAVARGGAVLVGMTTNGVTDRGTFKVYEAVAQDPNDPTGAFLMPVPTCKAPTSPWSLPPAKTTLLIDTVNLNGPPEADADIETALWTYANAGNNVVTTQQPATVYICYTPLGRSYFTASAASINFNGMQPSTTVLEVRVSRGASSGLTGASVRSVMVEPNGMPRILTKLL
jgi:type II secretory pathway pseudopilin PulG